MAKFRYRIWCETESAYVYHWADSVPTECPNDAGHTIDVNKIAYDKARDEFIFDSTNGPDLKIKSPDGNTIKGITLNNDGNLVIEGSEIEHNTSKYEVTHIDEKTTTSNSYIDIPNVIINSPKPKAGTYLILFSCVARCSNSNGWAYVILNGEGTGDISHSQRRHKGNSESSLSSQAVLTLDGSQYVKVRMRRDSKGSAEFSNMNLVAVRLGD
jgi:hypothetical protein